MPAHFGAPDLELWSSPLPDLLREIAGLEPEWNENHVRLDEHLGTRSIQRLAVADAGGSAVVALWPAELKSQALYLYSHGRAHAMLGTAEQRRWRVTPRPHLAFFNSHASQRLYMETDIDTREYIERWEGLDRDMIRRFPPDALPEIRAWLKDRGYLSSRDASAFERFKTVLGRRNVDVRPALMLVRRWRRDGLDTSDLAAAIRDDVNALLQAADEPVCRGFARR